jgi:uncharacterized protein (TIGR04255 family)
MTEPIVSFANPPVVEVSAGVAFPDLGPEGVALASSFWRDVARAEFPALQFQPPYVPTVEQFAGGQTPFPSIQMMAGYPAPRLWASGDEGQYMLQLQSDWFACNWRRVRPQDAYDRWASRRSGFQSWFTQFSEYAAKADLPVGMPTQCEVTYVNHITPNSVFRTHRDFRHVFNVVPKVGPLMQEQLSADIKFIIEDDNGEAIGRLHTNIVPGFDAESRPIYVFQLTARGRPPGDDIMAFLDRGRELIDRTFVSLTTADMHQEWGRTK